MFAAQSQGLLSAGFARLLVSRPCFRHRSALRCDMFTVAQLETLGAELRCGAGEAGVDECTSRSARRAMGAYFTPLPLVDFVVSQAFAAWLRCNELHFDRDGTPAMSILDPAAGDGRFLESCARWFARSGAARGYKPQRVYDACVRKRLRGIERDAEFARVARTRLGHSAAIHVGEAVLAEHRLGPVDVVVGNPPYVRSIRFRETDPTLWQQLRGRFAATSTGEWDLYAAFIERALGWLAPTGVAALIVPSRWLTAQFARRLRGKLAQRGSVQAVVDFGASQIFSGVTTYTSVVVLGNVRATHVQVARRDTDSWLCARIDGNTLDDRPWRLWVGDEGQALSRLAENETPLGEVARIAKGAGTNADRVYVFDDYRLVEDACVVYSRALGEHIALERGALRACFRGRDVGRDQTPVCLVPYEPDGSFIEPEEMHQRWPRVAAYLMRCRTILERRERGRFRGPGYYCFGRPQNMAYLGAVDAKVVIPDVTRGRRATIDRQRAMVLDSAYAIRPIADHGYTVEALYAVLQSRLIPMWLRQTGIPLRGGYTRMKTAYLTSLPVPNRTHIASLTAAVASAASADYLDDLVRRAYGISEAIWR